MDEHRLTSMPVGYDEKLFSRLFEETKYLRIKLARSITPSKFGTTYEDILSDFDCKFIFTFTKYYGLKEGQLKGRIIQSLKNFRVRYLKYGATHKNSLNDTIDIMELYSIESREFEYHQFIDEHTIEDVLPIFRPKLSSLSFQVFTIDYNPPLYIITRVTTKRVTDKIPVELILNYLGFENNTANYNMILKARKEYRKAIADLKD